jgi:hypothetical protein
MEEDDWYKQRPRVADEDSPSEGGDLVDLDSCDFGAWIGEDEVQDSGAATVFDVEDTAVGTSITRGQVAAHEGYSLPSGSSDIEVLLRRAAHDLRKPKLRLPWEKSESFFKDMFVRPSPPALAIRQDVHAVAPAEVVQVARFSMRSRPKISQLTTDSELELAVRDWVVIIYENLQCSSAGRQIAGLESASGAGGVESMVRKLVTGKNVTTLRRRGASLRRFIEFARGDDPVKMTMPPSPSDVYKYLQHLEESKAPPGTTCSFISSLRYASGLLGSPECLAAADHPFVASSVRAAGLRRKPIRQRRPLTVREVIRLQSMVSDEGRALTDRVAAGLFTFMIMSGARFSDAQLLDTAEGGFMYDASEVPDGDYLEASTRRSKTQRSIEARLRLMPLVAPVVDLGIASPSTWAQAWMRVRSESGLAVGDPVPAPGLDGKWLGRPLTTSQGGKWLRGLLECDVRDNVGTHSCKVTILSWMSKRGCSLEDRSIVGHHLGNLSTVLCYSRDSMAGPLRRLRRLLIEIKRGLFRPDATRSGYIEPATDTVESESSGSSSDEEAPRVGAPKSCEQIGGSAASDEASGWTIRNVFSHVVHFSQDSSEKTVCGRIHANSSTYVRLTAADGDDLVRCMICARGAGV